MTDPQPIAETKNTTLINNEWITLSEKRNGVDVQRAFAGLNAFVSKPDGDGKSKVEICMIHYWQRELYPNNAEIKTELKNYILWDLPYTEITIDGQVYTMEELLVLTGFVNSLGYPGIINPARDTLINHLILAIDAPNGYPLRLNTRDKTLKVVTEQ